MSSNWEVISTGSRVLGESNHHLRSQSVGLVL
jgi:hypothetical protein